MEDDTLLQLVRPVVAKINGSGTIEQINGGFGGFLGHEASSLHGISVFDLVEAAEGDRLAKYFIQNADDSVDSVSVPMPLRLDLLGTDGRPHPVDIIPTPYHEDGVARGWVVVALPVASTTSVSGALEAEMAGEPRTRVRRLLAEELTTLETGWFLIDLDESGPDRVTASHDDHGSLAHCLNADINAGWAPWRGVADIAMPLHLDKVPPATRTALDAHEFTRLVVAPVLADGEIIAAYLHTAQTSSYLQADVIMINVMDRIKRLVDVTSLILTRWNDQDELTARALSDHLTGLSNRASFSASLTERCAESALVYIDIDRFKWVNDQLGHETGDQVLREVADRIVAACRPGDVVARLGGDEFAVLLDGVDIFTARAIGQRIVESIREPMDIDGCAQITVSAGLTQLSNDTDSIDEADQAMLRAKRMGRDQLVVSH